MANANTTWNVLRHRPIEELAPNLLRVEGTLPRMALRRVMTVAKRTDGALVIHNGIALEEEAMRRIEALGEPAFLVVPNAFHRLDAPAYKARYPRIRVVAPRGAKTGVSKRVPVDLTYDEYPQDEAVRLEHVDGVREAEGVMIVRSPDGITLVLNDLLFNMPHAHGRCRLHLSSRDAVDRWPADFTNSAPVPGEGQSRRPSRVRAPRVPPRAVANRRVAPPDHRRRPRVGTPGSGRNARVSARHFDLDPWTSSGADRCPATAAHTLQRVLSMSDQRRREHEQSAQEDPEPQHGQTDATDGAPSGGTGAEGSSGEPKGEQKGPRWEGGGPKGENEQNA